jgi:hypothetical protein
MDATSRRSFQTVAGMLNDPRPELSGKTPEMWRKSARRGFLWGHPATQKSGRQDLSLSACAKVSYWQPFRYPLEILEISH